MNVHGEAGHVNVLTRDQDSIVTGFGKHARVIAFLPQGNELYIRVDHVWGLPRPTEQQILHVARKDQGLRGRWKLARSQDWEYGGIARTDCYFTSEVTQ